jgi:hypothetical protein
MLISVVPRHRFHPFGSLLDLAENAAIGRIPKIAGA